MFAEAGVLTLVSFISPYARDRDAVRSRVSRPTDFVEVYMKIPVEVCEQRDPKVIFFRRAGRDRGEGEGSAASRSLMDTTI